MWNVALCELNNDGEVAGRSAEQAAEETDTPGPACYCVRLGGGDQIQLENGS